MKLLTVAALTLFVSVQSHAILEGVFEQLEMLKSSKVQDVQFFCRNKVMGAAVSLNQQKVWTNGLREDQNRIDGGFENDLKDLQVGKCGSSFTFRMQEVYNLKQESDMYSSIPMELNGCTSDGQIRLTFKSRSFNEKNEVLICEPGLTSDSAAEVFHRRLYE